jgi:hypothetical protein
MEERAQKQNGKRAPRVLVSLTAKTQPALLSQALEARRLAKKLSHLYDPSVPENVRFHGLLPTEPGSAPSVRREGPAALSPYVVYLSSPSLPSPHDLIDDGRIIRLDFLRARPLELSEPMTTDFLSLSGEDVASQLAEDLPMTRPRVRGRLDIRLPSPGPVLAMTADGIDLSALHPAEAPRNFDEYFELPEDEETEDNEAEADEDESEGMILRIEEGSFEMTVPDAQPDRLPLPNDWKRGLAVFVFLALAFVLPLQAIGIWSRIGEAKAAITDASSSALSSLQGGAASALAKEPDKASQDFANAGENFAQVERSLDGLGGGLSLLGSGVADLAEAGQSASEAAERVSDGFVALQSEIDPTPTDRLNLLATYFSSALPHLQDAAASLKRANLAGLPADRRDQAQTLKDALPPLVSGFEELLGFAHMANTVLGGDGIKRYLVVFQNNTELRPTGGFMGSFAEIELVDGKIVRMDVPGGGTYDLRSGLTTFTTAPGPLQLLSARWEFQDLNWFPDFPTSARKLLQYYGEAGGETVDGIIAVNATLVPKALQVLGPVDMPDYGKTVTADNFIDEAQRAVELDYDKTQNKPKAFIGDLAKALLARATDLPASDFPALLDLGNQALAQRDVQVYFADDALEKRIQDLGWGGQVKWTDGDYLMPVDTNLGGGKTDGVIEENVNVDVNVADDGTVTDTVAFTRTHYGIPGALFTGVNNVDYLRLYVPKGSELLSASGFKIPDASLFKVPDPSWQTDTELSYEAAGATTDATSGTRVSEEDGKTVFGNWVQTKPGTSSTATFTYRLPFKIGAPGSESLIDTLKHLAGVPKTTRYSLVLQKQSGVVKRTTHVHVHAPASLSTLWSSHDLDDASFDNGTDAALSALFERTD